MGYLKYTGIIKVYFSKVNISTSLLRQKILNILTSYVKKPNVTQGESVTFGYPERPMNKGIGAILSRNKL